MDVNDTVIIVGLKYRFDLNGACAIIQKVGQKYTVLIHKIEKQFRVKRLNMVAKVTNVRLLSCKDNAIDSQNRLTGDIANYNPDTKLFHVQLSDGNKVDVQAERIIWPKNTKVCVVNLINKTEHNGKWGRIVEYMANNRVRVNLDGGKVLALRLTNITISAL